MIVRELINLIGFKVDEAGLRAIENRVTEVGKKMQSIGTKMSAAVTLPIAALSTVAVMAAAKVESVKTKFEVLTGSAEKTDKLMKELFQFEAQTPFNLEEVLGYANRLIMMKVPLGDITEMMTMLGNASAGSADTMGSVMEQLFQIKMFGRAQTQDLKIMAQAGVPLFEKLQEISGKTGADFRKWIEGGEATYEITLEALRRISEDRPGLMAKQAKTLTGLFSSLTSAIFRFNASIGQSIVDAINLKAVVAGLIGFLDRLAKGFADLSPVVRKSLVIAGLVAAALGPILVALGTIGVILPQITAFLSFLTGTLGLTAPWLAVIVAGALALVLLIEDIITYLSGGKSVVGEFLGPWALLGPKIMAYLSPIIETAKALFDGLVKIASGVMTMLRGIFENDTEMTVRGIEKILWGIVQVLWNVGLLAMEALIGVFAMIWEGANRFLEGLFVFMVRAIDGWLISLVDIIVKGIQAAWEAAKKVPLIGSILSSVGGALAGGAGGFAPSSLVSSGSFGGGASPATSAAGSAAAGGIGPSKQLTVNSTIAMTVPEGTPEAQVNYVETAAKNAVKTELEKQMQHVLWNNPVLEY